MQRLSGYIIAALMASGFFTSSLSAATLAELEAQYTKDRDAIAWKFVDRNNAVRAGYTNALITLEAGFKSKGALEGVLAVRKERESYAASVDGKLPEGQAIPEILDLRAKQKKMAADAVLEEKKAIVTNAQQYVDKLKVLEKDLTVADKIDTAVIVQTKRKQVMEQQDVVAALAALRDAGAGRAAGGDVGGKAEDPVAGDPRDGSAALFNGTDLGGWSPGAGKWTVEDRAIKGASHGGVAKLTASEWLGPDYEFYVKMKVIEGDDVGIMFHDQGWRSYLYSPKSGLTENHTRRVLTPPFKDFAVGSWHEIRVATHGKQVQISVNGKTVWRGDDLTADRGRVGLWVKGESVAVFSNLRIKLLKPLETMVAPKPDRPVKKVCPDGGGFGGSGSGFSGGGKTVKSFE